jgi:uncharacterized protein YndB with AHSA1/START domain
MSRTLPAPRSRVFSALTEPDELARWWGPNGFSAPRIEIDLRVGGAYRIAMQPPEGEFFYLVGEFREVDPPARLIYTFRWEDPDPEDQETIVTLSLEDLGDTTEIEFWHGEFATERRRALHDEGWANSLDRLHELMSSGARDSAPR